MFIIIYNVYYNNNVYYNIFHKYMCAYHFCYIDAAAFVNLNVSSVKTIKVY